MPNFTHGGQIRQIGRRLQVMPDLSQAFAERAEGPVGAVGRLAISRKVVSSSRLCTVRPASSRRTSAIPCSFTIWISLPATVPTPIVKMTVRRSAKVRAVLTPVCSRSSPSESGSGSCAGRSFPWHDPPHPAAPRSVRGPDGLVIHRRERLAEGVVIESERALQEGLTGKGDQTRDRGCVAAQNPGCRNLRAAAVGGTSAASMLREQSSRNRMSSPRTCEVSARSPHCGRARARPRPATARTSRPFLRTRRVGCGSDELIQNLGSSELG